MAQASTMNFKEAVAIATSSLWAHKLRSVLTLIGVVIGVAAVIAVVSLINGANHYVATRVFRLGADVFGVAKTPSIVTNVDDYLEFQKRRRITYVEDLLPGVDPIGKEVRWRNIPCQVIGVGKKEGSALGTSLDNWIILPLTTYNKEYGTQNDSLRITSRAGSATTIQESVDEVRQIMRGRRHLDCGKKDDVAIETSDSFLSLWKDISGSFFLVTIAIASISLLVGGVVIMNIMLVSVKERTREIGLRKALGARSGDILRQFLIESSTISLFGGVLGVICGVLLAQLVSLVSPLPSAVQLWSVIGGLLVALSVGLFFGTYPASKAARLDPVVALRSE